MPDPSSFPLGPMPSTVEGGLFKAVMERENLAGKAYTTLFDPNPEDSIFSREVPGFNYLEHEHLFGAYRDESWRFANAKSPEQLLQIRAGLDRERHNLNVIDQAGTGGVLASMAAGILSPENFIPIAGLASKSRLLARAGNALARPLKAGAEAAAGAAISEAFLQIDQDLRSTEESIFNVATGAAFGLLLGGAASGLDLVSKRSLVKGAVVRDHELLDTFEQSLRGRSNGSGTRFKAQEVYDALQKAHGDDGRAYAPGPLTRKLIDFSLKANSGDRLSNTKIPFINTLSAMLHSNGILRMRDDGGIQSVPMNVENVSRLKTKQLTKRVIEADHRFADYRREGGQLDQEEAFSLVSDAARNNNKLENTENLTPQDVKFVEKQSEEFSKDIQEYYFSEGVRLGLFSKAQAEDPSYFTRIIDTEFIFRDADNMAAFREFAKQKIFNNGGSVRQVNAFMNNLRRSGGDVIRWKGRDSTGFVKDRLLTIPTSEIPKEFLINDSRMIMLKLARQLMPDIELNRAFGFHNTPLFQEFFGRLEEITKRNNFDNPATWAEYNQLRDEFTEIKAAAISRSSMDEDGIRMHNAIERDIQLRRDLIEEERRLVNDLSTLESRVNASEDIDSGIGQAIADMVRRITDGNNAVEGLRINSLDPAKHGFLTIDPSTIIADGEKALDIGAGNASSTKADAKALSALKDSLDRIREFTDRVQESGLAGSEPISISRLEEISEKIKSGKHLTESEITIATGGALDSSPILGSDGNPIPGPKPILDEDGKVAKLSGSNPPVNDSIPTSEMRFDVTDKQGTTVVQVKVEDLESLYKNSKEYVGRDLEGSQPIGKDGKPKKFRGKYRKTVEKEAREFESTLVESATPTSKGVEVPGVRYKDGEFYFDSGAGVYTSLRGRGAISIPVRVLDEQVASFSKAAGLRVDTVDPRASIDAIQAVIRKFNDEAGAFEVGINRVVPINIKTIQRMHEDIGIKFEADRVPAPRSTTVFDHTGTPVRRKSKAEVESRKRVFEISSRLKEISSLVSEINEANRSRVSRLNEIVLDRDPSNKLLVSSYKKHQTAGDIQENFNKLREEFHNFRERMALDAIDFRNIKAVIKEKYFKLRDVATPKEARRLEAEERNVYKDLDHLLDGIRNNRALPQNEQGLFTRAGAAMRKISFMRFMGGITLSSFPDVGNIVAVNRVTPTMETLQHIMKKGGIKNLKKDYLAEMAWAIERYGNARARSQSFILDEIPFNETRFEKRLDQTTELFGKLTVIDRFNGAMKAVASLSSSHRVLGDMQRMIAGKATQRQVDDLASVGIDLKRAKGIVAEWSSHAGHKDGKYNVAQSSLWKNEELREIFESAVYAEVDRAVVTLGVGDTPKWMHSEWGKFIGQFKSFAFASHSKLLIANLLQRYDYDVAAGIALSVGIGGMTYALKKYVKGDEPSSDPTVWAQEAVDRSGTVGFLFELNNMAERISGNAVGISALTGGPGASRYAQRNFTDVLTGVNVGTAEDIGKVIQSGFKGELKDSDIHRITRMIPFTSLFYMQYLTRQAENQFRDNPL